VGSVEVGTVQNVVLTVAFSRGTITANNVLQAPRSGEANNYTINGVNQSLTPSLTVTNVTITSAAITYSSTTSYTSGVQPLDSKGGTSGSAAASGNKVATTSITGLRRRFWGLNVPDSSNSADIRDLTNSNLTLAKGSQLPISTVNGTSSIVVAYPATIGDIASWRDNSNSSVDLLGSITKTVSSIPGVNGYAAINYYVYRFKPDAPWDQVVNYTVTI
jgi:hypothetical protein